MAQGEYTHPSYLTRQMLGMKTIAGVGTTAQRSFPSAMRIRNLSALASVAGTQTSWNITVLNGTSSIGNIAMGGTAAKGAISTSGDLNATIAVGTALGLSVAGEATGVADVTIEAHLDPAATWS